MPAIIHGCIKLLGVFHWSPSKRPEKKKDLDRSVNYTWGKGPKPHQGEENKTANQAVKLSRVGKFLGSEIYPGFGLKNVHPSRALEVIQYCSGQ
jgi:hypothetical protein